MGQRRREVENFSLPAAETSAHTSQRFSVSVSVSASISASTAPPLWSLSLSPSLVCGGLRFFVSLPGCVSLMSNGPRILYLLSLSLSSLLLCRFLVLLPPLSSYVFPSAFLAALTSASLSSPTPASLRASLCLSVHPLQSAPHSLWLLLSNCLNLLLYSSAPHSLWPVCFFCPTFLPSCPNLSLNPPCLLSPRSQPPPTCRTSLLLSRIRLVRNEVCSTGVKCALVHSPACI